MSSRRTSILTGILLAVLAGYFALQLVGRWLSPYAVGMQVPRGPRHGDSISNLQVRQRPSGAWTAEFDYVYTGVPPAAQLFVELTPVTGAQFNTPVLLDTSMPVPERGSHHVRVDIHYPGFEGRTVRVAALLRTSLYGIDIIASQQINQVIDWPDLQTWARNQRLATRSPADNLKQVQELIDAGGDSQIAEARLMLDRLLEQNPKFDAAYVELARIALKTNWGPEGLHQAENLLATALQLRPDNADAKILLAYVYAHQRRFAQAEVLFKEVAATHTTNLWLGSNWGEMLEMEHQLGPAIAKYREVIGHPLTHDRNDRAREFAYGQLLELLRSRKDFDGMEALYQQRIAEFGPGSCYSAEYTRFLLQVRGNIDGAIDSARRALNQSCDDAASRQLLGLAEYAKWAGSKGSSRTEALNEARIFLPMSASALYLLATSDHTVPAIRQLVAAGEPIDQKDNDNLDALAYALQARDPDAVRRLMALGARAETPVGAEAIPAALLPVLSRDIAAVRLLRKLGVRYSRLRYRGATAIDFAKQQGNEALLSALGSGDTAL